jgi:hypothetical protein
MDWKEQFDKDFPSKGITSCGVCGLVGDLKIDYMHLKTYIQSLLDTQKQEILRWSTKSRQKTDWA